jgi:hydroxyacylglutathione hydrolase
MIFRRFYDAKLAQASYLIGCARTGEALVVDANRDYEQYVEAARAENLRVSWVTETHIHADFVSGSRELAAHTGAQILLSDAGGLAWRYSYAKEAGARLLTEGSRFDVGAIRIDVLHTPGHTPEHLTFLVTDTAAGDRPMGAFTGDFLFVGDVGRPDLLERAVKVAGTMEQSTRQLFASLQRFRGLPGYLQIWPGHGAGSACGKSLSAVPQSTLGYEALTNWAFGVEDEDAFVRLVLEGQPDPPTYFAVMKALNRMGPPLRGALQHPIRASVERLADAVAAGAFVIDTRAAAAFAAGHLPGSINIPLDRSFSTWAGWIVPYDRDIYLVADERGRALDDALHDLSLIGLDRITGYAGSQELERWAGGHAAGTVRQVTATDLAERLRAGDVQVLDVRAESEFAGGRVPGALNIPVGQLRGRLDAVPRDRTVVVQCQSGARSAIAASVLVASGFRNVVNLAGGLNGWKAAGLPVASSAA